MVGRRKLRFVPFEVENGAVPKAQHALTVGHCPIQLGVWGPCRSPSKSRAEPWWGVQGAKPPESSEDPACCDTKKRSKTYSHSVIFTFLRQLLVYKATLN